MADEHSFQIRPKGSKAAKTSDLRGQDRIELLTTSKTLCFQAIVKANSKRERERVCVCAKER